jgi:hypothetical protein
LNLAGLFEYLAVTSWTFQALLVPSNHHLQILHCSTSAGTEQGHHAGRHLVAARTSRRSLRAGILSGKMNPTKKGLLTARALIAQAGKHSDCCCGRSN